MFADLCVHVYGLLSPTGQDLGTHKQGQTGGQTISLGDGWVLRK